MKLSTKVSALRKCEREFQDLYEADDDQETRDGWKRRERQADRLERSIIKDFERLEDKLDKAMSVCHESYMSDLRQSRYI